MADRIGPDHTPKRSFGEKCRRFGKAFVTKYDYTGRLACINELTTYRDGLIGNYDYAFLFKPNLPFMKKVRRAAPFFGLNDRMPVFLALLLGFQHALAMLAGVITPPIIISNAAHLTAEQQRYLVSTSLIVSGILSSIQITR